MQWSKLRTSVRALICPELQRRVDFHITGYRVRSTRTRSGLITVDGKRVLGLNYDRFIGEGDGWCASVRGNKRWFMGIVVETKSGSGAPTRATRFILHSN